jgi:hypothetical protein
MSQPRVVSMDRDTGTGVVAIPANTDTWPFYYRREALALIANQVGPSYKIVSEGEVKTGVIGQNTQQTTTDQASNPRNPNQTVSQQTTSGSFWQQNTTEWQIRFVRMPAPAGTGSPFTNRVSPTGGPAGTGQGVTPIGGTGPIAGPTNPMVPSVQPNENLNTGIPAGANSRW